MATSAERRAPLDRRHRPTPMLSRYWLRGRRRGGRRVSETTEIYVDRYTRREAVAILAVLALCLVDWLWTLAHLARGIDEANPLLAWALAPGSTVTFSLVKVGVSLAAAFFLLLHCRFRYTRSLLWVVTCVYAGVLGVHIVTEAVVRG